MAFVKTRVRFGTSLRPKGSRGSSKQYRGGVTPTCYIGGPLSDQHQPTAIIRNVDFASLLLLLRSRLFDCDVGAADRCALPVYR
jgi:hypothetical protein